MLFLLPVLSTLLCPLAAQAESYLVVSQCGTLPRTPSLGSADGPIGINQTGKLCVDATITVPPVSIATPLFVTFVTPIAVNIPLPAQVVSGAYSDGALTTLGAVADVIYGGSGSATVDSILKGIYQAIKTITVTTTPIATPLAVTVVNTPLDVKFSTTPNVHVDNNPLNVAIATPIAVTQSTTPWTISGVVSPNNFTSLTSNGTAAGAYSGMPIDTLAYGAASVSVTFSAAGNSGNRTIFECSNDVAFGGSGNGSGGPTQPEFRFQGSVGTSSESSGTIQVTAALNFTFVFPVTGRYCRLKETSAYVSGTDTAIISLLYANPGPISVMQGVGNSATPWTVNQGTSPWLTQDNAANVRRDIPATASQWAIVPTGSTPIASAVQIGGVVSSSESPKYSSNTIGGFFLDLVGKLITSPYANRENMVRGSATLLATANATLLPAPTGGLKNYVTDLSCMRSDSGTSAIIVSTNDVTSTPSASTFVLPNTGGGGGFMKPFQVPLVVAANTAFLVASLTSTTGVQCSAEGFTGY